MARGLFDKDLSNRLLRIPQWCVEKNCVSPPDEVIACHTALLPPAAGQRRIFIKKKIDVLVCFIFFPRMFLFFCRVCVGEMKKDAHICTACH